MFVVAGDAGADRQVGAAFDEQLADFGVDTHEMGQGVKDRSLAADALGIDVGAGVYVSATVEEEAGSIEEAVFGSDVEQGCATEEKQAATGSAAIEVRVAAVEERWIGIEQGGQFVVAAAEDREHASNVLTSAGSGGQEDLDAGGEALGISRISLNHVVEGGARGLWGCHDWGRCRDRAATGSQ